MMVNVLGENINFMFLFYPDSSGLLWTKETLELIHRFIRKNLTPSQETISLFSQHEVSTLEHISGIMKCLWDRLKYEIPFHTDKLQHLRKLSKGSRRHWNKFRNLAPFLGLWHLSPPKLAELAHLLSHKLKVYPFYLLMRIPVPDWSANK